MTPQPHFTKLLQEKCKITTVSARHLPELQQEIHKQWRKGKVTEEFRSEYLPRFKFTPPPELPNAQTIIAVAMPRPPTQVTFTWKGKTRTFTLPPTYTAYDQKRIHVEQIIAQELAKSGYKIATPMLPLKLLATSSGLAQYGKNNIAYTTGMGSFMRLTAVYSDIPCTKDQWQKPQTMKQCEKCNLCTQACPTGAIDSDRFLLKADKCLTYHNEKTGNIPFPPWIKPIWHNCIIGCIRCQAACPENKPFLQQIGETAEFNEAETTLLLKGTPAEQTPAATREKMQRLSLTEYFAMLPRNLAPLLN